MISSPSHILYNYASVRKSRSLFHSTTLWCSESVECTCSLSEYGNHHEKWLLEIKYVMCHLANMIGGDKHCFIPMDCFLIFPLENVLICLLEMVNLCRIAPERTVVQLQQKEICNKIFHYLLLIFRRLEIKWMVRMFQHSHFTDEKNGSSHKGCSLLKIT